MRPYTPRDQGETDLVQSRWEWARLVSNQRPLACEATRPPHSDLVGIVEPTGQPFQLRVEVLILYRGGP
jgi:hypothetical protein